jgi:hypothetical protein
MPLNLRVGAVGAVNRPAHASKQAAKQDSAAAAKAPAGDTAEVSRVQDAPAPAEFGLDEARAAAASVRRDIAAKPGAALAAQANARAQVAVVLAG